MIYLLIFFVLAMIIAPLLNFLPTARQKHQIKLRDKALALGMQVQLATIPVAQSQELTKANAYLLRNKKPVNNGVAYRLRRSEKALIAFKHQAAVRVGRTANARASNTVGATDQYSWFWFNQRQQPEKQIETLLACFDKFPEDVQVIESSAIATMVYWQENADIEAVETIQTQLQVLQEIELAVLSEG